MYKRLHRNFNNIIREITGIKMQIMIKLQIKIDKKYSAFKGTRNIQHIIIITKEIKRRRTKVNKNMKYEHKNKI